MFDKISRARAAIDAADSILIGAGSGLSTSAGFVYTGERFREHFGDFIDRYGFSNLYEASFYPYPSEEEYWAFWSRVALYERYSDIPKPQVFSDLLSLVSGREYFVITTNVDHLFQRTGFDKQRLFYTQGDYGLWQCAKPCCQETVNNRQQVLQMVESQRDRMIPASMVPRCPHCGGPLTQNLRCDDRFVEDAGWHEAASRYSTWLNAHKDGRIVFLDLGSGGNTPAIFKYPFMQMTYANPLATYISINLDQHFAPREISDRSICIVQDISQALGSMMAVPEHGTIRR